MAVLYECHQPRYWTREMTLWPHPQPLGCPPKGSLDDGRSDSSDGIHLLCGGAVIYCVSVCGGRTM